MIHRSKGASIPLQISPNDSALATTLVLLTLTGGGTVFECLLALQCHGSEPLVEAFSTAVAQVESGQDLATTLSALVYELGPHIEPLLLTLQIVLASGVSNPTAIMELHRMQQRKLKHQLSRRVQRLPTLMLLPMIGCFLPAFMLLSLIPILLVTLSEVFTFFPN